MSKKPWSGRFSEKTDRIVEDFTSSIDIDKRLYAYDIEGSIAHCRTLAKGGIISKEDADTLIEGLRNIKNEIERGKFQFDKCLEDIHMHIETRLVEQVGKVALSCTRQGAAMTRWRWICACFCGMSLVRISTP